MKRTGKYAAALAVLAAGSVLYVSLPAHAIELDKVEVTFKREATDARGHMPPPPGGPGEFRPQPGGPRGPMPPEPPHHGGPGDPRGRMSPPPYEGPRDPRGFAPSPQRGPGPGEPMPPEPPHHGPRHMPPPRY